MHAMENRRHLHGLAPSCELCAFLAFLAMVFLALTMPRPLSPSPQALSTKGTTTTAITTSKSTPVFGSSAALAFLSPGNSNSSNARKPCTSCGRGKHGLVPRTLLLKGHCSRRRRLSGREEQASEATAPSLPLLQMRPAYSFLGLCQADPAARLRAEDFPQSPRLPWAPRPGKYLLALCQFGRLSNNLICLREYFWMAGLLNRTLVVPSMGLKDGAFFGPSTTYQWHWSKMLDFGYMRRCLRGAALQEEQSKTRESRNLTYVLTVDEYLQTTGAPCLRVDRALTFHDWHEAKFDKLHTQGLQGLCSFRGLKELLPEQRGDAVTTPEVLEQLRNVTDPVFTMGTLFRTPIEGHNIRAPSAPFNLAEGCTDLWSPPSSLLSLVDRAVVSISGGRAYAALHLRRGDFERVYGKMGYGYHYPTIAEVARTVQAWMRRLNLTLLYVASDGSPVEMHNLKELLQDPKLEWPVVFRDIHGWHSKLLPAMEADFGGETALAMSAVEKYICSHAEAFLATFHSTFSGDILRIRAASSTASCKDSYLDMALAT